LGSPVRVPFRSGRAVPWVSSGVSYDETAKRFLPLIFAVLFDLPALSPHQFSLALLLFRVTANIPLLLLGVALLPGVSVVGWGVPYFSPKNSHNRRNEPGSALHGRVRAKITRVTPQSKLIVVCPRLPATFPESSRSGCLFPFLLRSHRVFKALSLEDAVKNRSSEASLWPLSAFFSRTPQRAFYLTAFVAPSTLLVSSQAWFIGDFSLLRPNPCDTGHLSRISPAVELERLFSSRPSR